MIVFELFTLQYIATNLNWINKTITLYNETRNIISINIKHNIRTHNNLYDIDINLIESLYINNIFTIADITKYWLLHIDTYSKYFNINFIKLCLGIHYILAPFYITNNVIYIGIFIIDTTLIYKLHIISSIEEQLIEFNLLSLIKPYTNKYNIISGIFDKNIMNFDNRYIYIDKTNIKIPLKYMLLNIKNYFPKLEIIINKQQLQSSFKVC